MTISLNQDISDLDERTMLSALSRLKNVSDRGITFISGKGDEFLSYKALYERASFSLYQFKASGIRAGDEVILQLGDNRNFLILFWACLMGRIIPVPLSAANTDQHTLKLLSVYRRLKNPYVVSDLHIPELLARSISVDYLLLQEHYGDRLSAIGKDIAYIQFSSGSTGDPKGVILTHSNLSTNCQDIIYNSAITVQDSMLSWMPLSHDMGLICFHLTGVHAGIDQYIMPASLFVKKPLLWMDKASEYKVTQLYSPNFGYHYFLSVLDTRQAPLWDLHKIRLIYNGAEPIVAGLCTRFLEALRPYGLQSGSMFPGYGLAEASVAVTLSKVGSGLHSIKLDRSRLNIGDKVRDCEKDDPDGVEFVSVGYPVRNCRLRICDQQGNSLKENHIGHIEISGGNVTGGYYNNKMEELSLFTPDGWLKTGDLGFCRDAQLIVTGRSKNIIIVNGQNYYPQDIETIAAQVNGVDTGRVVACGIKNRINALTEVVLFIQYKGNESDFLSIQRDIKQQILGVLGLYVTEVIAIKKIPKTTSGKIQNYKLVEEYEESLLEKFDLRKDGSPETGISIQTPEAVRQALSRIVCEVCGYDRIGESDNFFEMGISSMLASRLVTRIQDSLQTDISLPWIFEHPTIEAISTALLLLPRRENGIRVAPLPCQDYYDLSHSQRRFWLMDHYQQDHNALKISYGFNLSGILDKDSLIRALKEIIHRHEILRTIIRITESGPQYSIAAAGEFDLPLELFNLEQVPDPAGRLGELEHAEASIPLILEEQPLIRIKLVRLEERRHVLLLSIHHIISDGWSLGVFVRELCLLYRAFSLGQESPLSPLPFQYKDFQAWMPAHLTGQMEGLGQYWKEQFSGTLPLLRLPVQPLKTLRSYDGGSLECILPEALTKGLKKVNRDNEATLYMTLVSVLYVLLYKYSGQTDIVIGTDSSGRKYKGLEDQIGLYIRTIALRCRFSAANSFRELLQTVKRTLLAAYHHEDYPFDLLVEDLGLNKDRDFINPLFNVLVLMQNFTIDIHKQQVTDDLMLTGYELDTQSCIADLQFEFTELEQGLSLMLRYNTDLFTSRQMRDMMTHFQFLATVIIADPTGPIKTHSIFPPEAQRLLAARSSGPNIPRDPAIGIVDLFEQAVTRFPDEIAMLGKKEKITYRRLNERVNRMAHYFIYEKGLKTEDLAGILLPRSEGAVVAILAVLKSGAAYIPVDPAYPKDRIDAIVEDSNMRFLLTEEELARILDRLPDYDPNNPRQPIRNSDLAYVMYTSGSTGKPKGVMIEHRSLTDYVLTFSNHFNISPADRIIHQSALSFDTSIEEIFPALCAGSRLLILEESAADSAALLNLIGQEGATVLSTTPQILNIINAKVENVKGLRLIISGGDVLRAADVDHLIHLPGTEVYNTYGPSETTVCASFHKLEASFGRNIIGNPIANHTIYILDEALNPVPTGAAGEIYIGGAGVGRGYLNREALTKERFIDHPFEEGARIYRTGDLGRWTEDGIIEFIGRTDDQVKIRGYRIEPGEIENVFSSLNGIDQVVVIAVGQEPDRYLAAYYTTIQP
ncbi:MAG TPA: amino acid adenylation domain-containing protein, partial [Puia sp.]|nr:amino acid adenylation domain-containing protein [Puia sp.]